MRFSATTLWMNVKARWIVSGLVFAVGFYGGLTHKVLVQAFWPGSEAFAGLTFFFGLGVFLGLTVPRVWARRLPILKPEVPDRELHPVSLARLLLSISAAAVLASVLIGAGLTRWIDGLAARLPERFLLDPITWKLLASLLPALAVLPTGVCLGLVLNLGFSVFVGLACPNHLRSEQPEVQKVIGSLGGWVLVCLGISWALGYFLSEAFLDRWFVLVLVPVISCLGVIFISLIDPGTDSSWLKHDHSQTTTLVDSFPERAGPTSRGAGLVVILLGWLVPWSIAHWTYALSNWLGADRIGTDQGLPLAGLALMAGTSGIKLGIPRPSRKGRDTFLADRRGLVFAVMGISLMLAAMIVNFVLKAGTILTISPQIVLPLLFAAIAFLWGINLGLIIPLLAVGRPNRFDLWVVLIRNLVLGAMFTGPMLLIWNALGGQNLLAIAFASLIAIAFGGVATIYHEPRPNGVRKSANCNRLPQIAAILFLYLSLAFIVVIVPHLKKSWLRPTFNGDVLADEAAAGVVYLIQRDPSELVWANRLSFPERTVPALRFEAGMMVSKILRRCAEHQDLLLTALLVGGPFLPDGITADLPVRQIEQFDIDRSIRKMEFKFLGLDTDEPVSDLANLNQRPVHCYAAVAFVPDAWPRGRPLPHLGLVIRRLIVQARHPDNVWIVSLVRSPQIAEYSEAGEWIRQLTGRNPKTRIVKSKTEYQWRITTTSPLLAEIPP